MNIYRCEDPSALRTLMNEDAGETAYALGDLDAAMWSLSEYWGAYDGERLRGFVLFFYGFEIPALTMHGEVAAVEAALNGVSLPMEAFCLAPARYHDAIARHYDMSYVYPLLRMTIQPEAFQSDEVHALQNGWMLRQLDAGDADALNALYAQAGDPGEAVLAFSPSQIELGVFYGVEDSDGALMAAAGTHVVSVQENVGAVGNVFTMPDLRGRGLGSVTTSTVTQALFEMGVSRVVLNVKENNKPAIRVYEKLGYRVHTQFIEGPVARKH